jgi:cytochrome c553
MVSFPHVSLLPTLAALLAASALPARAQDARALQTATLASTCANCHGTAGRAAQGSTVPGLAGRPAGQLVEQMRAFKDGSRPATVMHQIAKGYSDEQIARMAAYFAAIPAR